MEDNRCTGVVPIDEDGYVFLERVVRLSGVLYTVVHDRCEVEETDEECAGRSVLTEIGVTHDDLVEIHIDFDEQVDTRYFMAEVPGTDVQDDGWYDVEEAVRLLTSPENEMSLRRRIDSSVVREAHRLWQERRDAVQRAMEG